MGVPAVTNTNNRRDDAEDTTNWAKEGGAAAPSQETDFVYQGTYSVSSKIGTNAGGHRYDDPSPTDMTVSGDEVIIFKAIWTNYGALVASPSAEHRVGSDTSNYYRYYIADGGQRGDLDYPVKGGWIFTPIDPNVIEWVDVIVGTPSLTAIDYFATWGDFTGLAKSENVATDALDISPGLFQVDGTGTIQSGRARWERYENHDVQTTANRFGHIVLQEGVYNCYGKFVIGRTATGTVTATEWYDANQTVVFLGGRVDVGWNGIEIDLGNASTVVEFVNCSHKGQGRRPEKALFHTTQDVSTGDDDIHLDQQGQGGGDWIISGQPSTDIIAWGVYYSKTNGGTQDIGLSTSTIYYAAAGQNVDYIALTTVRANAYTQTGLANLTAGGNEEHQLELGPCNLPVLEATGTSGSFTADLCTFQQFNTMTLTSACTFTGSIFINCWLITTNGAAFDSCTFQNDYLIRAETQMIASDPEAITNCTFDAGALGGHAIQCNTTGTYDFAGNIFNGYGPAAQSFNTFDDVEDAGTPDYVTITGHPYTTGDCIDYSNGGGTDNINLINGRLYYLRSLTVDTVAFYPTKYDAVNNTNAISLITASSPGETHYLYSTNAAFVNASGGTITLNVSGGSGLTIRNGVGSTTVVNNTVQITLTGLVNPTEVRVYNHATGAALAGQEDVTTGTYQFSLEAGTVVDIRIYAVQYLPADILVYTIPGSPTSIPIQQVFDRNYNNP